MKLVIGIMASALFCSAASKDINTAKALGGTAAPLTIELYSSFACTHCKEFHDRLLPLLVRDYVVRGKACIVYRECFNAGIAGAREAAIYATAAARIGKYQQVSDALFKNQQSWMASRRVWDVVASVLTAAEQQKVQALAKDPAIAAEVDRDMAQAIAARVASTPTMVVTRNSKTYPFPGVPSYRLLSAVLNELLGN
jgi:protein-disulfide isomerase